MSKQKVLFLCTHNAVRSQMAEGFLRSLYGDKYEVFSAGASPTKVNPLAVKVMSEAGIDVSSQTSKSIESYRDEDFDLVVTVCKNTPKTSCPFCSPPGSFGVPKIIEETIPNAKRFIEHGFNDPSDVEGSNEDKLNAFRKVRDEIKEWIEESFNNIEDVST